MMVTGGRDGSINVWSCHRGRHLQAIDKAHPTNPHSSKGEGWQDEWRAPHVVTEYMQQ